MRGLLTALLLFVAMTVQGQPVMKTAGDYQNRIIFQNDYFFESDAITTELGLEYYNNGFITNEMKDRVTVNLKDDNRMGAEVNNEIRFQRNVDTLFGLENCFYSIAIRNRNHVNSRFSRDIFELYFRGNKNYAGEQADVSDFVYQNLVYQQINFTFGHRYKRQQNHYGFTTGISLNKGQKHYLIETADAFIYTEPYGEYIDFDVDGELHRSDSSDENIAAVNGLGAAIDASFWWESNDKNRLTVSAENFGFIEWNDQSTFVSADTIFHFDGVDVTNLFDLNDTIRKTISLDSSLVEPYLTERKEKSYASPLPALLKLNYTYNLKPGKMRLEAEAGYLLFATALPYGTLRYTYILKHHEFGLNLRYGGYGLFNAGLSYQLFYNHIQVTLESDYLSSMIDPQNGRAHGAFLSLGYYF